jgi:predicted ArsR family transcriptional regulator
MIKLPEGIDWEPVPVEKRYRSVSRALMSRINTIYEGLYGRFGEAGLDLIREVSRQYGEEIAARSKKYVHNGSAKELGLLLIRIFENINSEGEVTEFSDDRVVIELPECPYPFTNPEICAAHTTMEETVVELLGENLGYAIPRSRPKGDPVCAHLVYRKR